MEDDGAFPVARLDGGACMVAAHGQLDSSTAWRLQDALGTAAATGARRLIADLAAVTYLDADALAVLSASAFLIHRSGARLVIVTDDPWLLRLLGTGTFEDTAEVEPTLRDAVRLLEPTRSV